MDIIQRILEQVFGFQIFRLMGVTDIDDKIIKRAKLEKRNMEELTRFYESEFLSDMQALGVRKDESKKQMDTKC